jgi:dihydroorotase
MTQKTLIKNATIVNENEIFVSDILIEGQFISKIDKDITDSHARVIDDEGLIVIP